MLVGPAGPGVVIYGSAMPSSDSAIEKFRHSVPNVQVLFSECGIFQSVTALTSNPTRSRLLAPRENLNGIRGHGDNPNDPLLCAALIAFRFGGLRHGMVAIRPEWRLENALATDGTEVDELLRLYSFTRLKHTFAADRLE
jgi:hypothetical protein